MADYLTHHERLLDALERRDPRTPELVAEHLRLSARLIGDDLARETDGSARASQKEERPIAEEERTGT